MAFVGGPNGAVLGHPFVVTTTNREDLYFFSFPTDIIGTGVIGQSAVTSETRFGGYDVNVALNLWQERGLSIRGLVGFRNLILNESLTITDTFAASDPGTGLVLFRGGLVDPPSELVVSDSFVVHNRFYGGQVGSQVDWSNGRWSVGVLGKLAVGVTQQLALVNGETRVIGPAGPQSAVGGTFAQVTNIGRHYRSELADRPRGRAERRLCRHRLADRPSRIHVPVLEQRGARTGRPAQPADQPASGAVRLHLRHPRRTGQSELRLRSADFWAGSEPRSGGAAF
ncbi:MAG: BBP7 family outer membrane beta-barrel protein [Gemmataceae bacterium]